MLETAFTKLVGCSVPIQLAAMPDVCTLELAAAVADAGGLGMLGAPLIPPPDLPWIIDRARLRGWACSARRSSRRPCWPARSTIWPAVRTARSASGS